MSEQAVSTAVSETARKRRLRDMSRFIVVVLLLHVPLFAYPILRLCQWFDLGWLLTLVIFLPLFFSQIIARIYLRSHHKRWVLWLRLLADLWLGISPVVLCLLLAMELPVLLGWVAPAVAAWFILLSSIALTLYSMYQAVSPAVVTVSLASRKLQRPVRFVQLTDVHIGSRSSRFLAHVIDKVNELQPEFVCITGDFIDATGIGEERLVALKNLSCPVYFSIGNHEKYEDLPEIVQRLRNLGVQVLRNAAVADAEMQFIGIDDMEDPQQVQKELARLTVATDKYVVLLYHRPRGLDAAAAAGVDLMLSGHTHNGQIVPFNFIVDRVFDKAKGLFRDGDTHLYVSSGTGTWGPKMRLGTRSEITLFELVPAAPAGV